MTTEAEIPDNLLIVDRALEILSKPQTWCQGWPAYNHIYERNSNNEIDPLHPTAVVWSMEGALRKASFDLTGNQWEFNDEGRYLLLRMTITEILECHRQEPMPFMLAVRPWLIITFNDRHDMTQTKIVEFLKDVRKKIADKIPTS